MRKLNYLFVAVLALVLPAFGQSDRGTLTGTVKDSTGAVIPGASVTATHVATNVTSSTITTDNGLYSIPALPAGIYKVRVELSGFKAWEQSQIVLAASTTVRADATLEIGQITESVEVRASSVSLQTENAKISSQVSNKMVDELPLVVEIGRAHV